MDSYGILYETNRRDNNQDSVLLSKMQTAVGEVCIAAVADGLGGMDHGEIASGYVIEELSRWFYTDFVSLLKRRVSVKYIKNSLYRLIYKIHNDLKEYGIRNNKKMATTLAMFLFVNGKYWMLSVGDSALYKMPRLINKLEKQRSNELTRCIGLGSLKGINIKSGSVRNFIFCKQSTFLLCSDGFYNHLDVKQLTKSLSEINKSELKEDACKEMKKCKRIKKCLKTYGNRNIEQGETDNMTAIFLQY